MSVSTADPRGPPNSLMVGSCVRDRDGKSMLIVLRTSSFGELTCLPMLATGSTDG